MGRTLSTTPLCGPSTPPLAAAVRLHRPPARHAGQGLAAAPAPYFAEYPFLMKHAVDVISVDTLLGLRPVLLGLGPGAPSRVTPWLLCSQAPAVSTSRIISALRVPARRPRLPRGRHRYVTSPAVLLDQTLVWSKTLGAPRPHHPRAEGPHGARHEGRGRGEDRRPRSTREQPAPARSSEDSPGHACLSRGRPRLLWGATFRNLGD